MPRQTAASEIHLRNIAGCLKPALTLLNDLKDAFGPPFIQTISSATLSLINTIQNVKRNKNDCIQLTENIHRVLYAIVNLYLKSEANGSLPPSALYDIGKFAETLHKIYSFVETHQGRSRVKNLLRHNEMNTLFKACRAGLDQALEVFQISIYSSIANDIEEIKTQTENMHEELLELISKLSDGSISERSPSVYHGAINSSSSSLSMLPPHPKIFHGRETELEHVLEAFSQESPRIAILGGGGMGKTTLARAVLHHPNIHAKFEHRFFVSAESATDNFELAALIGLHLGLSPGPDIGKLVVQYFSEQSSCLLILDNMETPWDPIQTRGGTEDLLALLADVESMALMASSNCFISSTSYVDQITMRGAERPGKIRWSRPFLPPLEPLSDAAARQIFIDITAEAHDSQNMNQLLRFTDNMPLAVDLIAHLVEYEGSSNVLARWKTDKTALLSIGADRKSNLDASIRLSLSSPRITSGAKDLLRLLSVLPDGLSDSELLHSNLSIQDIRGCKATLLATSLAHYDNKRRLRTLTPIREHVNQVSPPSQFLIHPLQKHFHALLDLYKKYNGAQLEDIVNQITSNLANLHQVLSLGLDANSPDIAETIRCIINLNSFRRITERRGTALMDQVSALVFQLDDHKVKVHFIAEVLLSATVRPIPEADQLIAQGISHCDHFRDPEVEAKFYQTVGYYHFFYRQNPSSALQLLDKALALSRQCGDTDRQCGVLIDIADIQSRIGDPCSAQIHANEAARLANLCGNLYQESSALWIEAECKTQLGDYPGSITRLNRAKEILSVCGMKGGLADSNIAMSKAAVHLMKSEYTEARDINVAIVENTDQDPHIHARALVNIAEIDVLIGAPAPAVQQMLNEAGTIFNTIQYCDGITCCELVLADLKLREGDDTSAKTLFCDCLSSIWGRESQLMSFALERLGDIDRWHPVERTSYWPMIYLCHAQQSKDKLEVHKALYFLGDVFLSDGDQQTTRSLLIVALEGFTCMDIHRSRAQCMLRLGDLAREEGKISKAVELWTAAQPLFQRSLQATEMAKINIRLASTYPH
ncbi:ATPase-AAA-core domain-containing protein [Mycena venus]|uniref:ATPase-AAA-core domain-containing protein n=1 Tax=Mycena venus TaxID=2733690 RepID=A0A8H6X812_9AGAR|nr:ATPase-AAA-core domain-containing protein [Mycena venus]